MIEIEIRAKTNNLDLAKRKIKKLGGKLVICEKQVDKIFGRNKDLDSDHKIIEGKFSARIRQKGDKKLVELKEIRRTGSGLEFSSPIYKIDDGVYLLKNLDYVEAFTVSKTREDYKLEDFEISLDKVEKLGNFIEIEHIDKTGNNKEIVLQKCKDLLKIIDPDAQIESKKYGDLMQELINQNKNL